MRSWCAMLLLHFPLCCLSSSVDYCRKVKRVIEIKDIQENATNRDHYQIVLGKKFCSLTHSRVKEICHASHARFIFVYFTSMTSCCPSWALELAGFFTSIKVYCVPCFIYINITIEDWVIVHKRNQLHMPLFKRWWGSRFLAIKDNMPWYNLIYSGRCTMIYGKTIKTEKRLEL
jgi:hypothetical protein